MKHPAGYQVPITLLRMLNKEPAAKRWFIDELKVTDLQDGAPPVKQLHDNPVTASTSVAAYLEGDFNNSAANPDAVVTVGGVEILVHRHVVAKACEVLRRRWDPMWSGSSRPFAIDTSLSCDACSTHPSYSTALLFLEYFYTGEVKWPGSQAELGCALELLVMAGTYDVQHLVCIVEQALESMLNMENCCTILTVSDHHQALQLQERCLHFIRQGHRMIKNTLAYSILSGELKDKVEERV